MKQKKIWIGMLFFAGLIAVVGFNRIQYQQSKTATYVNETYHISLQYDKSWKPNPYYSNRYEGDNGFFQVVASTGANLTIDKVVSLMIDHPLVPYGSSPAISVQTVDGQEARLILPSKDAPTLTEDMASMVIRYPKPITIDGEIYDFLILHADKEHIVPIAETLRFLEDGTG